VINPLLTKEGLGEVFGILWEEFTIGFKVEIT